MPVKPHCGQKCRFVSLNIYFLRYYINESADSIDINEVCRHLRAYVCAQNTTYYSLLYLFAVVVTRSAFGGENKGKTKSK